jgi:uncharacterized protein with HEPN domain
MQRDPRAFLWDVRRAADAITRYVGHRDREGYLADDMLRSAVERQFEIIGEALNQLARLEPDIANRIPELASAVAFRNILIHGYTQVDSMIVWETITDHLPALNNRVAALLAELEAPP